MGACAWTCAATAALHWPPLCLQLPSSPSRPPAHLTPTLSHHYTQPPPPNPALTPSPVHSIPTLSPPYPHSRSDAMEVARRIKEQYCYVCPDMAKEFKKYDDDPMKWIKQHASETRGQRWQVAFIACRAFRCRATVIQTCSQCSPPPFPPHRST